MANHKIVWSPRAKKAIENLHRNQSKDALRIFEAVEQLLSKIPQDIKKMQGYDNLFRLRVGDFRVIFQYVKTDIQIVGILRKPDFEKRY